MEMKNILLLHIFFLSFFISSDPKYFGIINMSTDLAGAIIKNTMEYVEYASTGRTNSGDVVFERQGPS